MSLIAMDMPETHAELVDWLEQHLVGLDLAALVAELSAVHGSEGRDRADSTSAVNLLGGQIPEVMESGLTVLDTEQIRALLQRPRCLLELQELVLTSGGAHWDKRMEDTASNEFQRIADTGWRRVKLSIAPQVVFRAENGRAAATAVDTVSSDSATEVALPSFRLSDAREKRNAARGRSVWPSVLATAAMLMIGAFGLYLSGLISVNLPHGAAVAQNSPAPATTTPLPTSPAPAAGWGWERPGAIPTSGPPSAYLTALAHAADEWYNKRPADVAGLEQRITDFRNGCNKLVASTHDPLQEEDRQWLVEKCKSWSTKLDEHLAALKNGADPLAVRAAADETIMNLMKAMRTRADAIASA